MVMGLTREEAEVKAEQMSTDGKGLYQTTKSSWVAKHGILGRLVYDKLQASKVGFNLDISNILVD